MTIHLERSCPPKVCKNLVPLKIFIRSRSPHVLAFIFESSNCFSMGIIIVSLNSLKLIPWMLWNVVHVMVVHSKI